MDRKDYPKVTVILRGISDRATETIIDVVAQRELDLAIEITRNSANFCDLARYIKRYPRVAIGAGTVITAQDAQASIEAGCQFVLSPIVLAPDVIELCHANGLLVVSGAYSPTEVHLAASHGADIVKVFPIKGLPMSYVNDIRAPLGPLPIMAVGGVNRSNMFELFAAGIDYVGVGTGLFPGAVDELSATEIESALVELQP